jgi:hypothetical protein
MCRIQSHAPYPASDVVLDLRWDDEIVRFGGERAGDNWPITWGDDGRLYTSLGDGYGFAPRDDVYTLAFAAVDGIPSSVGYADAGYADDTDLSVDDVPSNIDEPVGWGSDGIKASGIIMVDGVLYLFVRNYVPVDAADAVGPSDAAWKHSRMATSTDRGRTWVWADWYFAEGFGCPEFVQFGPDYAGSRDDYVYICSQDGNSAYDLDPDIALARVHRRSIADRTAWEFFAGLDSEGVANWTAEIESRASIFHDPAGTQRVAITYNAAIGRYFLVSAHGVPSGIPHTPALGVFDAPEPWGPWTVCYYHDEWASAWMIHHKFPTKWMSLDGSEMWLLFSGEHRDGGIDYCMLCRKAVLSVTG